MQTTIPAEVETEKAGTHVPGTIGFDIYLGVLGLEPAALRAPKLPRIKTDLPPLLAAFALDNPNRPIPDVSALEFATWISARKASKNV